MNHAHGVTTTVACDDGTVIPLVRYGDEAAATAVILAHGFIQNSRAFSVPSRSLIDFLVAAGHAVYTIELRGRACRTARSSAAWDLLATVDHEASEVAAAVRRRHGRVAWVGHSMGGLIGCAHAGKGDVDASGASGDAAADRVDAVVAIGSPLFPGRSFLHRRAVTLSIVSFGRVMGRLGLPFDGARYGRGFVRARRLLDSPLGRLTPLPLWRPGSFADDRDLEHTLRVSFAGDSHDVLADLVDLVHSGGQRAGRLAMGERLGRLTVPLLAIAGTDDALAPPDSVHALYARARSADKRFLEVQAGHIDLVVGDRAPVDVWRPIASFLDDVL